MVDNDVQCTGECSKPKNLQFRNDIEDILKKPYDKKEYDTLWLLWNLRKPMQGHKELRDGHDITYAKYVMDKSYLDEYHGTLNTDCQNFTFVYYRMHKILWWSDAIY